MRNSNGAIKSTIAPANGWGLKNRTELSPESFSGGGAPPENETVRTK